MKRGKISLFFLLLGAMGHFLVAQTNEMQEYVYKCDFVDGVDTWWASDTEGFGVEMKNGKLYLSYDVQDYNFRQCGNMYPDLSKDFEVQTYIKQIEGTGEEAYGLCFDYVDLDNGFYFIIKPNGFYRIYRVEKGVVEDIVPWTKTQAILTGKYYNRLSLKKTGRQFSFYLNKALLHTMASPNLKQFSFGYYLDGASKVEVDFLYILQHHDPINLVPDYEKYGEPVRLNENINSAHTEKGPLISPDGKHLYVTREDHPGNVGDPSMSDAWVADLKPDSSWTPLRLLPAVINNEWNNSVSSVSADNKTLLLDNVYLPDGSMKNGISITHWTAKGWTRPKALKIDHYYNDNEYAEFNLSADGQVLVMSAERKDSYGNTDLYVSFLKPDSFWTKPLNLGGVINSYAPDACPFLAADNKTLFFSSAGHPGYGSMDVFIAHRLDDSWTNWSVPQNLGPKVNKKGWNAYYCTNAAGNMAFTVGANMMTSGEDIYMLRPPKSARPTPVCIVKGTVTNVEDHQPIHRARIAVYEIGKKKEMAHTFSRDDGSYTILLERGKHYSFVATKEDYVDVHQREDVTLLKEVKEVEVNIGLTPFRKGYTTVLNNLFFKVNKSDLLPESFHELDNLAELMLRFPKLKVEIGGHTSQTKKPEFEKQLSLSRAQAVKTYLVSKGVPEDRIVCVGYGYSKPISTIYDEVHQAKNRRVEMTMLEL